MPRRIALFLLLPCLALLLFACKEARMAVPTELTVATPAIPVEQTRIIGWDSPFDFGPYKVSGVKRGWTSATAWGFMVYESYRAEQSYEYRIAQKGEKPWQCKLRHQREPAGAGGHGGRRQAHLGAGRGPEPGLLPQGAGRRAVEVGPGRRRLFPGAHARGAHRPQADHSG